MQLTAPQASVILLCKLTASELLTLRYVCKLQFFKKSMNFFIQTRARASHTGNCNSVWAVLALQKTCLPRFSSHTILCRGSWGGTRGDCSPLAHLHHTGGEHHAGIPAWLKPRTAIRRAARHAGERTEAKQNRSCRITPFSDRLFSRGCSV